jgi:cytidine deaminase
MIQHKVDFILEECDLEEIVDDKIKELLTTAVRYLDIAYAPYSNFHVGAAVLTDDGKIFGGSNQENASYPLCMCGERNALYHTAMASPSSIPVAVAITARTEGKLITSPVMPCGACRQVILEYEYRYGTDINVYLLTNDNKVYKVNSVKDLLPYSFDGSFLS